MSMSNKTYDILKWIAMYLLPAAGTLYFALAGIWSPRMESRWSEPLLRLILSLVLSLESVHPSTTRLLIKKNNESVMED